MEKKTIHHGNSISGESIDFLLKRKPGTRGKALNRIQQHNVVRWVSSSSSSLFDILRFLYTPGS